MAIRAGSHPAAVWDRHWSHTQSLWAEGTAIHFVHGLVRLTAHCTFWAEAITGAQMVQMRPITLIGVKGWIYCAFNTQLYPHCLYISLYSPVRWLNEVREEQLLTANCICWVLISFLLSLDYCNNERDWLQCPHLYCLFIDLLCSLLKFPWHLRPWGFTKPMSKHCRN